MSTAKFHQSHHKKMAQFLTTALIFALGLSLGSAQYLTSSYKVAAQSYSAPVKSYSPLSYSSYQAPVQSYNPPSNYKLSSTYQAPAAPSYGASYKNSTSYGSDGYSQSNVRKVRLAVIKGYFTELAPGTSQSFLTELLAAIQGVSNLRFQVTIRDDLSYPKQQPDGSWDGSIFVPLLKNEVDLVGPDLTSTEEGERVVDFTQPMLPYKLQVLVKAGSSQRHGSEKSIQYLVFGDDHDLAYLKNSPQPALQAIASNILQGQANGLGTIISSDIDAATKVLNRDNYAYIVDSPFVLQSLAISNLVKVLPCDLGGYFNVGFATQLGSTLRKEMNIALLQITQDGSLKSLLQKYNLYTTVQ